MNNIKPKRKRNRTKIGHKRKIVKFNLTDFDIGYLAGFLDADGSIGIREPHPLSVRIGFYNTDYRVIKWIYTKLYFQHKIEEKKYITKDDRKRDRQKRVCYCLYLTKKDKILSFLELVKPHLIRKQKQAELAIDFLKICSRRHNHRYTEHMRNQLNKIYKKNKKLNGR